MRLSENFKLDEFTKTSHPSLQDEPSLQVCNNLVYLCAHVLQPLRDELKRPVIINSGYRSEALNKFVGGVSDSYHRRGLAADLRCSTDSEARVMFQILKKNPFVDCVLYERGKRSHWLHVQTCRDRLPRGIANFYHIPSHEKG